MKGGFKELWLKNTRYTQVMKIRDLLIGYRLWLFVRISEDWLINYELAVEGVLSNILLDSGGSSRRIITQADVD